MATGISVEEIERLVLRLTPMEQLKLAARICEHLASPSALTAEVAVQPASVQVVVDWLDECDAAQLGPAQSGEVVDDLRALRQERADRM